MKYNSFVHELYASLKRVGVKNSILLVVSRLYDQWFDYKFKLDTVDRLELSELTIESDALAQGQMYQPSGVLPFRSMLKQLEIKPTDVFVDFGSGKGRTLVIAAMGNFKRVVGIEFSPELVDCANRNVQTLRARNVPLCEIDNVCIDAAQYDYQDDETMFYFFFPFDDDLMKKVLDAMVQSAQRCPRKMTVIYYYPVHASVIEAHPHFKLVHSMNAYGYDCLVFDVMAQVE